MARFRITVPIISIEKEHKNGWEPCDGVYHIHPKNGVMQELYIEVEAHSAIRAIEDISNAIDKLVRGDFAEAPLPSSH